MRWRALLIATTLIVALVPVPADRIERFYTGGGFPVLQAGLTAVSNLAPFPLFDVLIVAAALLWVWLLLRDLKARRKAGWSRTAGRVTVRTATVAAAAYLGFLLLWGLNYRRTPLSSLLDFDARRVTPPAARLLVDRAVMQLNALYERAHREGWVEPRAIDSRLVNAFWRAQHDLGGRSRIVPGRPKRTMFDPYFTRAGVAGMTDPYFLETLVASDLLPFERPFTVAHEWSHLAGFADEGDANFVGWLACLRGDAPHQYSGWLALYSELSASLSREEWRAANVTLQEGPRADLRASRERYEQHVNRRVAEAGWLVYDEYLKANRVEEGRRSYAQVVSLVLGTDFAPDGTPRLRARQAGR